MSCFKNFDQNSSQKSEFLNNYAVLPLVLGGILVLLSLFTVEASLMGKGLGELLQEFLLEFQSKKIMQSSAFVNKKNFINFSGEDIIGILQKFLSDDSGILIRIGLENFKF